MFHSMGRLTFAALLLLCGFSVSAVSAGKPTAANDPTLRVCDAGLVKRAEREIKKPQNRNNTYFNGPYLYCRALEVILQNHSGLRERAAREAFIAQWAHKYDATGELNTPAGVDSVLPIVLRSLGERFDRYQDEASVRREKQDVAGSKVGIGASLLSVQTRKPSRPAASAEGTATAPEQPAAAAPAPMPGPMGRVLNQAAKIGGEDENQLIVFMVDEDGPSAGLLHSADVIIAINGNRISGLSPKQVRDAIHGNPGDKVAIKVLRFDEGSDVVAEVEVTVTMREKIRKSAVARDIGDGVTVIEIRDFMNDRVVEQFRSALEQAAKGKAIIIDLRNNGGGQMHHVITMMQMVVHSGRLLVIRERTGGVVTEETIIVGPDFDQRVVRKNGTQEIIANARPAPLIPADMPIVILTNGLSASGSEMFAGALQTLKRAKVIGYPSVGKGEGQKVTDLPFGRRINVTSLEFLPGGEPINWVGIIPDIELTIKDADADDDGKDEILTIAKEEAMRQVTIAEERAERARQLREQNRKRFEAHEEDDD